MTSQPVIAAAAALGLLGLGACSGAAAPAPAAAEAPVAAGGPVRFIQDVGAQADLRRDGREGVLHLDSSGCFRVGTEGPALVWPAQAALDLAEPGVVRVHDRTTGASVRVGERVWVAGVQTDPQAVTELNRPLGPCQGPLLDVAGFEPRVVSPTKNARGALFPFG